MNRFVANSNKSNPNQIQNSNYIHVLLYTHYYTRTTSSKPFNTNKLLLQINSKHIPVQIKHHIAATEI